MVFVAVYQRALKLLYVDELLARVKQEFTQQYKPDQVLNACHQARTFCVLLIVQVLCQQSNHLQTVQYKYPQFEESFRQMLKDAENTADLTKGSTQSSSRTKVRQTPCPYKVDLAVSTKLAPIQTRSKSSKCCSGSQPETRQQGRGDCTRQQHS